jgi:ferric-dicitrate binding protein FerR (iron transport regulator)
MNNKTSIMNQEIPFDIIAKYFAGECSEKEEERLENWKKENNDNYETFEIMRKTWSEVPTPDYSPNVEEALKSVSAKLPSQKKKLVANAPFWIKIAAVLVLGIGLFGVYNLIWPNPKMVQVIISSLDPQKEIILPDNSKIILGRNSELSYPARFRGKTRTIEFSGEAYFEITSDKNKPFVIESDFTTTKIVGTAFNLRSYKNDSVVKITVTEGLVSFKAKHKKENPEVMVGVGEVGKLDVRSNNISKELNSDINFLAWQNGKLSFKDEKLGTALKTLSEFYGKTFTTTQNFDTTVFNGFFDSLDVKEAIEYMEIVLDVTISEKNNQFVLKPNN